MDAQPAQSKASHTTLPHQVMEELDAFRRRVGEYLEGTMTPDAFKACRLQLGIYGLRGLKDKQMVRVKLPGGRISSGQLERLAEVIRTYATGRGHVTTRQDIQLYEVPIERTPEMLRELADVGLTTREACGNSVRNVTACPFTGFCPDERFDVMPYAQAITDHFLRNPMSQSLPRKFKISISGCRHDRAMAPIHDIGAIAAVQETKGQRAYGFQLYAGGGLGGIPMAAQLLEPFTPVDQLLPTCDAIVRVFNAHGERTNRQRARMKFLIERIGFPEFQQLVFAERERLLKNRGAFAALPLPEPAVCDTQDAAPLPPVGYAPLKRWLSTNAQPQRQRGFWTVTVRLPLGDMNVRQMRELARIARWCSREELIVTQWQDLCLPWVESHQLERLYDELSELGLAQAEAQRIQDITACPGADTCQIGITSSRGLATALTELLERPQYKTDDLAAIRIKVSGCPNSCGQHHIADIGFFGGAKQVNGRLVPHYQMLLGGAVEDGRAYFGQPVVKLPAKRVPKALEQFLAFYRQERRVGESFRAFVGRVGMPAIQHVLTPFTTLLAGEEVTASQDWGQTAAFSLGGMGKGECAG